MPHAEHTVTVNRPAREIFDYLADGTHNRAWRTGVLEIERTSPADGEGATYRQVLAGPGGRRIDGDYRVTVFDPPRQLGFHVTAGPARPAGDPQARALIAAGFGQWSAAISDGLRRLHAAGHLPDGTEPDDLAVTLLAALQGGLILAQVQRDTRPLETAVDTVLDLAGLRRRDGLADGYTGTPWIPISA